MVPGPAGTLQGRREAGLFALQVSHSSFRYHSVAADDSALRLRIREITEIRVHYGYRGVHAGLNRHSEDTCSLRGCIQTMSEA